jgi:hypothetical protein
LTPPQGPPSAVPCGSSRQKESSPKIRIHSHEPPEQGWDDGPRVLLDTPKKTPGHPQLCCHGVRIEQDGTHSASSYRWPHVPATDAKDSSAVGSTVIKGSRFPPLAASHTLAVSFPQARLYIRCFLFCIHSLPSLSYIQSTKYITTYYNRFQPTYRSTYRG